MKKQLLNIMLFTTLLLLSVAFVNASEYVGVGQNSGTYDVGFFNEQLTLTSIPPYTVASQSVVTPSLAPLISDLDGDGSNEIIVLDGSTVRIYHGTGLTNMGGTTLKYYDASNRPTAMQVADLNDDGKKELIIPAPSGSGVVTINMLNWDGTVLRNTYNLSQTVTAVNGQNGAYDGTGEQQIGCDDATNRCMIMYSFTQSYAVAGTTRQYSVALFNTTNMGNFTTETAVGINSHAFCLPKIPVITPIDINNNGALDFVFGMLHVNTAGSTDTYFVRAYEGINPTNLSLGLATSISDTSSGNVADGTLNTCRADVTGNSFTSPLIYDFDGGVSGKEVVFSTMHDGNSFRMYSYNGITAVKLDEYPESFLGYTDGTLVGNVFRADAFESNAGRLEFCTAGFVTNSTENQTSILCGSLSHVASGFDHTNYDVVTPYNISSIRDSPYSTLAGASQQDHEVYFGINGNADYDEVIDAFGVYKFGSTLLGNGILVPIWNNFNLTSQHNGAVIGVDYENVSRSDLIMLSPTNLFYFNDGFSNSPATITDLTINPCISSTWKQNTSVSIGVTPADVDNDAIHCQAYLYYGTLNEQFANDSSFLSNGATHNFGFTAFNISGSSLGRVECSDSHNPATLDNTEFTFSVNTNGVSYGDCQTSLVITAPTSSNFTNTTTTPATSNVISNFLAQANGETGLGTTILWLLLMGIVAIGGMVAIMREGHGHSHIGTIAFAVVGFTEALLLIVGVYLGYLGLGVMFTLIIVCVALVTMIVRKMFTNG